MKTFYFIDKDGKTIGPVTKLSLKQRGLDTSTYVWCEGMTCWQKASTVSELKSFLPPPPAPPAPPNPPKPPKPSAPPKPPAHAEYHSKPIISKVRCPYCKSYNTRVLVGKNIVKYGFIAAATLLGAALGGIGAPILFSEAKKNTDKWDNWACNTCHNSFKKY